MAASKLENTVRKILKKFKISELPEVLDDWTFLPQDVVESKIDFKSTRLKEDITWKIAQLCLARQLSSDDVADLDLHYISRHSNTERWTMYELKRPDEVMRRKPELILPDSFLDNFYNCIDNFADASVKLMTEDGRSWLRVYFYPDSGIYAKTNTVYLCHYERTNFFGVSPMKVKYREAIEGALKTALGLESATEMKLKGKDLSSLFQLAVNKNNQDMGQLWSAKIGQNPLTRPNKRKREDEESESEDERIHRAEHPVKQQRKKVLVDLYGTDQLPTLNKIEYKLDTTFRGRCAPEMVGKPFACTVKFEGKSVLEGVRSLVSMGVMSAKMPGHVKNLPFMASNQLTLKNR